MRISDWSSDVCSSDLYKACWYPAGKGTARCNTFTLAKALAALIDTNARIINLSLGGPADPLLGQLLDALLQQDRIVRSEEHTSELQSLMRISYAVFCLKKKTNITRNITI